MRADRLFSIVTLLQTRGRMTAQELSDELAVSERTLYRDVDTLSTAGIPIYADKGPGGGYALLDGYRSTLASLTEAEISALLMSAVNQPLEALGLDQTLQDAMLKLLSALPRVPRERAEHGRARVHLDAAPWFRPNEDLPYLSLLHQAVWEDRELEMLYERADGAEYVRIVEPYGLVAKGNWWYLIAATSDGMRTYRVSRIQHVEFTGKIFERPADFNLAAHWEQTRTDFEINRPKYEVRLRVAPELAKRLPKMPLTGDVESSLAAASPPDEHGWIMLWLNFEDHDWALNDILSYGGWAEVLEPPEFRAEIAGIVRAAAALYGG